MRWMSFEVLARTKSLHCLTGWLDCKLVCEQRVTLLFIFHLVLMPSFWQACIRGVVVNKKRQQDATTTTALSVIPKNPECLRNNESRVLMMSEEEMANISSSPDDTMPRESDVSTNPECLRLWKPAVQRKPEKLNCNTETSPPHNNPSMSELHDDADHHLSKITELCAHTLFRNEMDVLRGAR